LKKTIRRAPRGVFRKAKKNRWSPPSPAPREGCDSGSLLPAGCRWSGPCFSRKGPGPGSDEYQVPEGLRLAEAFGRDSEKTPVAGDSPEKKLPGSTSDEVPPGRRDPRSGARLPAAVNRPPAHPGTLASGCPKNESRDAYSGHPGSAPERRTKPRRPPSERRSASPFEDAGPKAGTWMFTTTLPRTGNRTLPLERGRWGRARLGENGPPTEAGKKRDAEFAGEWERAGRNRDAGGEP